MGSYKYVDRKNNDAHLILPLNKNDLQNMIRKRTLDKKCWSILKEVFVYIAFICVLYEVAFSNLSSSSMQYNILFQNTFVRVQSLKEIGLYDVKIYLKKLFFCSLSKLIFSYNFKSKD